MTCKDCIHYDACGRKTLHFANKLYRKDVNDIEKWCETFKDKSRFVELPCNVGDTVYWIDYLWNGKTKDLHIFTGTVNSWEFNSDKAFCEYQAYFDEKGYCQHLRISKFDKDWFIDKTKAEKMLKELNEK